MSECKQCQDLDHNLYLRDLRIRDLSKDLSKATKEADRVPFLERTVQDFLRARAASAIPEPGPTARDYGFRKGLLVAVRIAKENGASAKLISLLEEAADEWEGDFCEMMGEE